MDDFANALLGDIKKATNKWRKQKESEIRDRQAYLRRRDNFMRVRQITMQEAAWEVMEAAYMKASAGGKLPVGPRQIMYAARGPVQARTGKRLDDRYFTQTLLPNFCAAKPDLTAGWDIVWDARGNLIEPHTNFQLPLGTLQVREYIHGAESRYLPAKHTGDRWHTRGSLDRYGTVLFVEKEGFLPLFRAVKLAERYDLAIMSTKGVSTTAARQLVDHLVAARGVPVFVIRDFDVAGFTIAGTLRRGTRRYRWRSEGATDLGLRLDDVEAEGLEAEDFHHGGRAEGLTPQLIANGATRAEIAFLCTQRVELNAFPSDQLVSWIERKLEEHGVRKVRPKVETLTQAGKHFARGLVLERLAERCKRLVERKIERLDLDGCREAVEKMLEEDPELAWDDALRDVVRKRLGR
jgi:hypothetical protein